MKNEKEQYNQFQIQLDSKNNISSEKIKTTNVNILLNRVRVEKRKSLNKKLKLFSFIISVMAITIFFCLNNLIGFL